MARDEVILRFNTVSFERGPKKLILDEANFSMRRGSKIALMGQNGAGKTTIFQLIAGVISPDSGVINIAHGLSVAIASQVIPREQFALTVRKFFEQSFAKKIYDIDPRIEAVLKIVNLHAPFERILQSFSGGQQARLLLAAALIQEPDLLLLDEPTNNLDEKGIAHLKKFLVEYKKMCIVISHDADFLNAFTHGVLYLNVFTRKIEQYAGNYFDVVREIYARIEKENRKNAQLAKQIQENKDKANFFAHKGGKMRLVARRMKDKAQEMESAKVVVRQEDKTIRRFIIPAQEGLSAELLHISSYTVMKNHKPVTCKADISLRKNNHLLLSGPNGIGKSTLLESLARGTASGLSIAPNVRVGYYRQDFSTLNFDDTVYDSLSSVAKGTDEHTLRSVAAGFLITAELFYAKIGTLSEGQKGLVAFARLVLQTPGVLILDEPTNHINFRHLPVIAFALSEYKGAMILVSHVPEFVNKIRIDKVLDLAK